jgi:hypothetical protein
VKGSKTWRKRPGDAKLWSGRKPWRLRRGVSSLKPELSGLEMRKSLSGDGLRRSEAYRQGDTVSDDEGHRRQDLASDWAGATPVLRLRAAETMDPSDAHRTEAAVHGADRPFGGFGLGLRAN